MSLTKILSSRPPEPAFPGDPNPNPIPDRPDSKPTPLTDPRRVPEPSRPTDPVVDPTPTSPKWSALEWTLSDLTLLK